MSTEKEVSRLTGLFHELDEADEHIQALESDIERAYDNRRVVEMQSGVEALFKENVQLSLLSHLIELMKKGALTKEVLIPASYTHDINTVWNALTKDVLDGLPLELVDDYFALLRKVEELSRG